MKREKEAEPVLPITINKKNHDNAFRIPIHARKTFFILAEDSSIQPMEALRKSKQMMDGYKWKLFCLGLRFIGWFLLAILTLGIGFLWLIPYMYISFAKFYEDIKE